MSKLNYEAIAVNLNKREVEILRLLSANKKLGLADRSDDRSRQFLRKSLLIQYCGSPLRWQITSDGLAVLSHVGEA